MKRIPWIATVLVVSGLMAVPSAQAQIVGLKVTPTTVAPPQVDFDVTAYAVGELPGTFPLVEPAPETSDFWTIPLGTSSFGTTYASTPSSGSVSYFFTRVQRTSYGSRHTAWTGFDAATRPAIEFGDGGSQPTASLVLDAGASGPPGTTVYRGSFSHTYAGGPNTYTLRARKGPDWNFGAPGAHDSAGEVTTGSAHTGNLSFFSSSVASAFARYRYYRGVVTSGGARSTSLTRSSVFPTSSTWFQTSPTFPNTVVSITNTATTGVVPAQLLRFDVD